ncbi:MAG: phage tail tape measure protein [Citromicrobium sp.]|nr:phage tail tape measure protein [Citromicrobium sp.]
MANNRLNLLVNFSERGLSKLSGGMKTLVSVGEKGGDTFRRMTSEARALENELRDVRRELRGASGNVTELVDRERALERQVEQANEALRQRKALYRIDKGADALRDRGRNLRASGREDMVRGAALLAPVFLAAKSGAEFSSTMVDIQQKAELTDRQTAGIRNNILAAARAAKQMPGDMAAFVDTTAGLGILTSQEAARLAKQSGRFMTAFKVEGTDAAASLSAAVGNLELPVNRATKLFDMMAQGGNEGAFEVRDMAAALPGLTAQMKGLGQVGDGAAAELIAALQIVRRGTGDSASAATNVENLLAKLSATTTLKQFEKQGINAFAAIKQGAKDGVSPLETMIRLTRQATGGDMQKLGFLFPDMQAQNAMRQLLLDYEDFHAMQKSIGGAKGVTNRAFDQRVANDATVQMREVQSELANMVLAASPVLLPMLKELTGQITAVTTAVSDWAKKNPAAASALLKLVVFAGMASVAIGGLKFVFGGLFSILAGGYRYFKVVDGVSRAGRHLAIFRGVVSKTASVAVKAFGLLRMGAMFLARGLMQAGLMMLANPIVLAIVAVIAVVGLLAWAIYANWDKIKAAWAKGMEWLSAKLATLKEWFAGLPGWMKTIGKSMMAGLLGAINPVALGAKLIGMAKNGISAFKNFLGIKSPSRLFMEYGGHIAGGLALGVDRDRDKAFASARRLATGVAGAAAVSLSAPAAADNGTSRPASSFARSTNIEIKIVTQPGQSSEEIARAVRLELERIQREDDARDASTFGDY